MSMATMRFSACNLVGVALGWVMLCCFCIHSSRSFVASPSFVRQPSWSLSSTSDDDSMDLMRQMLESSWNSQTMGDIPGDSKAAASAAASCLLQAKSQSPGLFFVDLLLPAYDITQGYNIYDDVLAVEFCIALTQALEDQSVILVRDQKTLDTTSRVLEARKRDFSRQTQQLKDDDDEEEDDFSDFDNDTSTSTLESTTDPYSEPEALEDIDNSSQQEVPTTQSSPTPAPAKEPVLVDSNDLDSFRSQLLASWDDDEEEEKADSSADDKNQPEASEQVIVPSEKPPARKQTRKRRRLRRKDSKSFRLASLFGSDAISKGIDMGSDVVQALKSNALPMDDEDIVVILSAVSLEEMLAIRSLVGSFPNKSFIFVNCKVDPLPRELRTAETVYSLLPLVARATVLETNIFGAPTRDEPQENPPKVVVLRRYPEDWQIHVDVNGESGFELADTVPASSVGQRGPGMEYIVTCVKQYLQQKEFGI